MDSDHSTIGKTVVEYAENGRHIACLKKQLADIGEHLLTLGEQLRDAPLSVAVTAAEIQVTRPSRMVLADYTTTIPFGALDRENLQHILEMLGKAQKARQQLEKTLRGMGLEDLIREA